jgi:peptidoglycan hydrolase CwlO-like protein
MKNKKSIGEIALSKYALDIIFKSYFVLSNWIAVIIAVISIFIILFIVSENIIIIIFFTLCVIVVLLAFFWSIIYIKIGFYEGKKRYTDIIAKLSSDETKKIISDYLQEKIKSLYDGISSSEGKIQKLQSEIDQLKESIEESTQRIPELQEKLSKL